ncbi:hypothetical protein LTR08_003230 [Meristemomyces frigidus]|nr:hypothetical protein LTR08_003230 [Meristemomyces frigidus]
MASSVVEAASNLAENVTKVVEALHPYYPLHIKIDGWTANERSVPALLGVFFTLCAILFATTYFVAKRINSRLTAGELSATIWFVISGTIHIFFEGYYASNYATLGASQTWRGQMWKEYAFSDSRYLTSDSFVLCMESVTAALWGPGCFLTAAFIVLRHPMRFPTQMIVSMGQLYGLVLYYATCMFEHYYQDLTYSRPEAFYFWFYFFFLNFIWMVIPGYLIYQSAVETAKAVKIAQRVDGSKKAL